MRYRFKGCYLCMHRLSSSEPGDTNDILVFELFLEFALHVEGGRLLEFDLILLV